MTAPTLRSVLESVFATSAAAGGHPAAAKPHIHRRSRHYLYAVLVLAGHTSTEACAEVGVSPRTAEEWRADLRAQAEEYFGRAVTYEFAARYVLDEEWQRLLDSIRPTAAAAAPR